LFRADVTLSLLERFPEENAMTTLNRRRFIRLGGLGAAGIGLGLPAGVSGRPRPDSAQAAADPGDRLIRMGGDGLGLSPAQYSRLLSRLAEEKGIVPDAYSQGGAVEELETRFARLLGKERAVFMPTGTLANHLAVRTLAGGPSRVIVQEESHFYQDEGDCAQILSGLTLMPLAPGRATFTAEEVRRTIDRTRAGRVSTRISVIAVETPVRRKDGEFFDAAELKKIADLARGEGLKLHLDGARLFLQSPYSGESPAETARPFDTVYISLYKYFNAASGAILAGPKSLLDGLHHARRMFGGGLSQVWPFAAVALHFLDGFEDRFARAVRISEDFIRGIGRHGAFAIERIPSGTNLFRLRVRAGDPAALRKRLREKGIVLPGPQGNAFLIGVNETLLRTTAPELIDAFASALAG
jgi:threonine aldolase